MICLHFKETIFAGLQYWCRRSVLSAVVVVIVAAVDNVTEHSASNDAPSGGARDLSRVEFEERISVRRSWCALWHSFDLLDRLLELPTDCKLLFQAKKKTNFVARRASYLDEIGCRRRRRRRGSGSSRRRWRFDNDDFDVAERFRRFRWLFRRC